jgi:hypothetical protein
MNNPIGKWKFMEPGTCGTGGNVWIPTLSSQSAHRSSHQV